MTLEEFDQLFDGMPRRKAKAHNVGGANGGYVEETRDGGRRRQERRLDLLPKRSWRTRFLRLLHRCLIQRVGHVVTCGHPTSTSPRVLLQPVLVLASAELLDPRLGVVVHRLLDVPAIHRTGNTPQ